MREDNIKQELEIAYRKDLEEILINAYRRDLIFKVCACNALRVALDGNLLPPLFLKSLKYARKGDTVTLIEVSGVRLDFVKHKILVSDVTKRFFGSEE